MTMSEHPDDGDFGFEPDHGQDDHLPWETGGAHEPGEQPGGAEHWQAHLDGDVGAEADSDAHGHVDVEHLDELAEPDHAPIAGDLAAALATPGGTVFDLVSDHDPHWLAGGEDQIGAHPIDAAHYAHAWAQDDGTGMIGALSPASELPGEHDMDPDANASVSGYMSELVHGSPDELVARLWSELRPGTRPPLGAGGEPLSARESLALLAREVGDPVALSVVAEALSQVT